MSAAFVAMTRITAARIADVDAQHLGHAGADADVLDDPEHRVVRIGRAELGRVVRRPASVTGIAERAIDRQQHVEDQTTAITT